MNEFAINWVGRLQELGQKCAFVPLMTVAEASNFSVGSPSFKCEAIIKEFGINVVETAQNKKMAKTIAAKTAYEKICEKINAPQSSPTDKIAELLKGLNVKDDEMTLASNFFKGITNLKLNSTDISYGDLKAMLNGLNCDLIYNHDEYKQENGSEYRFRCEARPSGRTYPAIYGFGWSTSSPEEAKNRAVKQLINALTIYSNRE